MVSLGHNELIQVYGLVLPGWTNVVHVPWPLMASKWTYGLTKKKTRIKTDSVKKRHSVHKRNFAESQKLTLRLDKPSLHYDDGNHWSNSRFDQNKVNDLIVTFLGNFCVMTRSFDFRVSESVLRRPCVQENRTFNQVQFLMHHVFDITRLNTTWNYCIVVSDTTRYYIHYGNRKSSNSISDKFWTHKTLSHLALLTRCYLHAAIFTTHIIDVTIFREKYVMTTTCYTIY